MRIYDLAIWVWVKLSITHRMGIIEKLSSVGYCWLNKIVVCISWDKLIVPFLSYVLPWKLKLKVYKLWVILQAVFEVKNAPEVTSLCFFPSYLILDLCSFRALVEFTKPTLSCWLCLGLVAELKLAGTKLDP